MTAAVTIPTSVDVVKEEAPTASPASASTPSPRPSLDVADAPAARAPLDFKKIMKAIVTSLSFWMVVGMRDFSVRAKPTANIFLRPIQFVVFPLVFSSLVCGIAGHGDLKGVGRLGLKSFIYFEVVTTLALVIGLVMVNVMRPGESVPRETYKPVDGSGFSYEAWIGHLTPRTWAEVAGGELLQTFVASVIFGCATAMSPPRYRDLIVDFNAAIMKVMFHFVNIVIWTAPIGVCFAIAGAIGGKAGGLAILASLGKLVLTLYISLLIFVVVVFGSVFLIARINPIEFIYTIREPLLIAFSTATSEAALPRAIEVLQDYGVSQRVTVFTLTFGYAFNLDGSTLYLALASVFCCQATGVNKTLSEQIVMVLLLMITSKGVAGVRSASIIVLANMLTTFNIPAEPIAVILGVDWFMDMGRTFVNVFGNCLATVFMAKLEKEFRNAPPADNDSTADPESLVSLVVAGDKTENSSSTRTVIVPSDAEKDGKQA
ncbi:Sodium:dicarboxylate symporter family-domain-containing protein [Chytridium lagenaria]|nr:Sodium:dicarboxylate symporter family-domain-containing protein [Chytridium lagenaria]